MAVVNELKRISFDSVPCKYVDDDLPYQVEHAKKGILLLVHGIIGDTELFDLCAEGFDTLRENVSAECVSRAMAVKVRTIAQDPYEQTVRAALNLGHTVGHGIEKAARPAMPFGCQAHPATHRRLHILQQRHCGDQKMMLKHKTNGFGPKPAPVAQPGDIRPGHPHRAGCRCIQCSNDVEQGGFAATRRPH